MHVQYDACKIGSIAASLPAICHSHQPARGFECSKVPHVYVPRLVVSRIPC